MAKEFYEVQIETGEIYGADPTYRLHVIEEHPYEWAKKHQSYPCKSQVLTPRTASRWIKLLNWRPILESDYLIGLRNGFGYTPPVPYSEEDE